MDFFKIDKLPHIYYSVDVSWNFLIEELGRYIKEYHLDFNPDFQRGHIWTEQQQISYVEYMLTEPQSGRDIYINHPNWMSSFKGDMVLLDGKQRIEAALKFMNNRIPAYGCFINDSINVNSYHISHTVSFRFNVMKLKTRREVIEWYLKFNSGGTPHSKDEINRVKELLCRN